MVWYLVYPLTYDLKQRHIGKTGISRSVNKGRRCVGISEILNSHIGTVLQTWCKEPLLISRE